MMGGEWTTHVVHDDERDAAVQHCDLYAGGPTVTCRGGRAGSWRDMGGSREGPAGGEERHRVLHTGGPTVTCRGAGKIEGREGR